jgi:hypothetical protein
MHSELISVPKDYSILQARKLIALKIEFCCLYSNLKFRKNVVMKECFNSAKLVEIIPEIYRSSSTPRQRIIFALQAHLDDRTAIYTCIASLN